ncbi:MAG: serine/threonine-protein kinase, partial [Myxococcaceae bacterium]
MPLPESVLCPTPETLTAWSSGSASAQGRSLLERHLADCADCLTVLSALVTSDSLSAQAQAIAGRYSLETFLGAGAQGEVWVAQDLQLSRQVAVKLLDPELLPSAAGVERLLGEARTLAQITHPRVLRLYDAGLHDEQPFLVTERLSGGTLATWLRETPRSWEDVLRVFIGIADGLSAAHGVGIIHRDLKPSNVLMDERGEPHIADFGLAQQARASGAEPGPAAGTPGYL